MRQDDQLKPSELATVINIIPHSHIVRTILRTGRFSGISHQSSHLIIRNLVPTGKRAVTAGAVHLQSPMETRMSVKNRTLSLIQDKRVLRISGFSVYGTSKIAFYRGRLQVLDGGTDTMSVARREQVGIILTE